jgi:hypothetical protein
LSAAIAEHDAKRDALLDSLDDEMAVAYREAEAAIGDRVADVISPHDGVKDMEAYYRDNIAALEKAIEDEHAYNENTVTRQVDAREAEESDQPSGAHDNAQAHEKESGGNERQPGEDDAGFNLKSQTEAELKAKSDAEAAAREKESSAQSRSGCRSQEF